ncbi:hypothetical protein L6V77_24815 [Myxococcota bacterium]|nr:hypothetical protein [Myxococcota bacterium]
MTTRPTPPLPPEFPTTWPSACDALYEAFLSRSPSPGGFALRFHDEATCHFERSDGGPDYDLLGIDWVVGVLLWGQMYMPKQDGGYHTRVPLPPAWLAALRRLRHATWGEAPPRFATPEAAGPALLALASPSHADWTTGPWRVTSGPGGPVTRLTCAAGHPLDAIVISLDPEAGRVTAHLLDAEGPVTPLGEASLGNGLAADLAALGPASQAGFPAGATLDATAREAIRAALAASLGEVAADAGDREEETPAGGPAAALADSFGPSRWRLPGVRIAFGGPSWQFVDGVPRTTVYGRFRGTDAWVALAFTPDFRRVDFVENAFGPRPATVLSSIDVPPDDVEVLRSAYAHR